MSATIALVRPMASRIPKHAGGGGEQHAFRQQLPEETPPGRANGYAHGDFMGTRGPARHLQIGDVGAGDQQEESHGAEEQMRLDCISPEATVISR